VNLPNPASGFPLISNAARNAIKPAIAQKNKLEYSDTPLFVMRRSSDFKHMNLTNHGPADCDHDVLEKGPTARLPIDARLL
jgi:hypothetical protein